MPVTERIGGVACEAVRNRYTKGWGIVRGDGDLGGLSVPREPPFRRPREMLYPTEPPLRGVNAGVRVGWLQRFAAREDCAGLTTLEVVLKIIKPETKAASWAADAVERSYAQVGAAACPFLCPVAAVWRRRCDWSAPV